MGQAKNRGSFEIRKQEGIARVEAEELRQRKEEKERQQKLAQQKRERDAKLTPAQREHRRQSNIGLIAIQTLLIGASMR